MFAFTPTPIQGKLVVTKVFKAKPPIGSDFLKQKYFLELVLGQAPPSAHALNKHNSQFCVIRITIRTKLFYIPLSFIIFSTISASEKFSSIIFSFDIPKTSFSLYHSLNAFLMSLQRGCLNNKYENHQHFLLFFLSFPHNAWNKECPLK